MHLWVYASQRLLFLLCLYCSVTSVLPLWLPGAVTQRSPVLKRVSCLLHTNESGVLTLFSMRKVGPTGKMWRVFTSLSGKESVDKSNCERKLLLKCKLLTRPLIFFGLAVVWLWGKSTWIRIFWRRFLRRFGEDGSSRLVTSSPTLSNPCKTAWSSLGEKKTFQIWKSREFINPMCTRNLGPITSFYVTLNCYCNFK